MYTYDPDTNPEPERICAVMQERFGNRFKHWARLLDSVVFQPPAPAASAVQWDAVAAPMKPATNQNGSNGRQGSNGRHRAANPLNSITRFQAALCALQWGEMESSSVRLPREPHAQTLWDEGRAIVRFASP